MKSSKIYLKREYVIYILVAHKKEARALFQHFTCKRDKSLPFTLYIHDTFFLAITNNGKENAYNVTTQLLQKYPPKKEDILINFGICAGSRRYEIGDFLHVNTLIYIKETITLFNTPTPHSLECVDTPQNSPLEHLADMESFGIYQASLTHFSKNTLFFYKVVSDYFEPHTLTKALIDTILEKNSSILLEKLL